MYSLKQAGYLANQNLKQNLAKYGYTSCMHTKGLWKHNTQDIQFVLVVDDFGIQCVQEEDKNHHLNTLQDCYTISLDSTDSNYCGLTLNWDTKHNC